MSQDLETDKQSNESKRKDKRLGEIKVQSTAQRSKHDELMQGKLFQINLPNESNPLVSILRNFLIYGILAYLGLSKRNYYSDTIRIVV